MNKSGKFKRHSLLVCCFTEVNTARRDLQVLEHAIETLLGNCDLNIEESADLGQ